MQKPATFTDSQIHVFTGGGKTVRTVKTDRIKTSKTDKTNRIKTDKTDKTIRTFVRDRLNRLKVLRS